MDDALPTAEMWVRRVVLQLDDDCRPSIDDCRTALHRFKAEQYPVPMAAAYIIGRHKIEVAAAREAAEFIRAKEALESKVKRLERKVAKLQDA